MLAFAILPAKGVGVKRALQIVAVVTVCASLFALLAFFSNRGVATPKPWAVSTTGGSDGIARENARPGTTAWRLGGVKSSHPVEGFASRTSVAAGETLDVFVRTRGARFRADIFRMGWYGGAGGRLVQSVPWTPALAQRDCELSNDRRRTLACDWTRSFAVGTKPAWTTGVYLLKLISDDRTQSWVPFVVREATPIAPILFQTSVTTWQAYNAWGGRSSYTGPCEKRRAASPTPAIARNDDDRAQAPLHAESSSSPAPIGILPSSSPILSPPPEPEESPTPSASPTPAPTPQRKSPYVCGQSTRSRAVSYDRPYQWPGDGQFFRFEYPMLFWIESQGLPVAYSTDLDLHDGSAAMAKRRVFLSVGHDEYYSTPMRRALEEALARGTSLAFFGANDMFRHIRFEGSKLGADRVQVSYKSTEDPIIGTDHSQVTTQWREWPLREPEQALLGAQYECNPVRVDWVPTLQPAWLFRGTGFRPGDSVEDLVGYEYDRVMPGYPQPSGVVRVARSPLRCGGRASESNSTFYVAPSGAAVFDAGTLWMTCALGPGGCNHPRDPRPKPDARVQRMARNLIQAMLAKQFA